MTAHPMYYFILQNDFLFMSLFLLLLDILTVFQVSLKSFIEFLSYFLMEITLLELFRSFLTNIFGWHNLRGENWRNVVWDSSVRGWPEVRHKRGIIFNNDANISDLLVFICDLSLIFNFSNFIKVFIW